MLPSKDAGAARLTFGATSQEFFFYFAVNAGPSSQQTPWKRADFTRLSFADNNEALYELWEGCGPSPFGPPLLGSAGSPHDPGGTIVLCAERNCPIFQNVSWAEHCF